MVKVSLEEHDDQHYDRSKEIWRTGSDMLSRNSADKGAKEVPAADYGFMYARPTASTPAEQTVEYAGGEGSPKSGSEEEQGYGERDGSISEDE